MTKEDKERYEIIKEDLIILNIRYLIIWREYGNKRRGQRNRKNG